MVVIFVGCDCAGKSTCFEQMDKESGTFIKGQPTDNMKKQIQYMQELANGKERVVFDRVPIIDDIVYKPVFAKKDSELLHPDHYDDLRAVKAILNKCCVIYFECSTQILAERLNSRGDELVTVDQLEEIKNNYRSAFAVLNLTPYSVDTGKMTPEEVYTHVKGIIEYEESKNS